MVDCRKAAIRNRRLSARRPSPKASAARTRNANAAGRKTRWMTGCGASSRLTTRSAPAKSAGPPTARRGSTLPARDSHGCHSRSPGGAFGLSAASSRSADAESPRASVRCAPMAFAMSESARPPEESTLASSAAAIADRPRVSPRCADQVPSAQSIGPPIVEYPVPNSRATAVARSSSPGTAVASIRYNTGPPISPRPAHREALGPR